MLHRLRHRTPLPVGTKITLSDRSYIIEKLLGGDTAYGNVGTAHLLDFGHQEPNTVQQITQWMDIPSKSPGCLLILNDLHKLSASQQHILLELIRSSALGQNTVVLITGRTDHLPLCRIELLPLSYQQIRDTFVILQQNRMHTTSHIPYITP